MTGQFRGSEVNQKTIIGHPVGLFVLFFTEMWERFSYYGMRAILVLFLTSSLLEGGWAWERSDALVLYGWYTGLVYLTPIIGGFLADKFFGYRNAIVIGATVMALGHLSLAFETPSSFYLGLALLILGNGLFKPNIASIVGEQYAPNSEKKDGAYTIFYMGVNSGAFLGILLCGYIGERVGWSWGFGLAGIFMFFGMLQFYFAQKIFGDIGLPPSDESLKAKKQLAAEDKTPANVVRDRIIVITVFAFFTIFFWLAFEQAGGSMTIFARDYTGRVLEGGAAQSFFWINTLLTVVPLGIITWVLWSLFSKIFAHYPLSNIFLGSSFAIIWGIALWMLHKDFNTNTYEVTLANGETSSLRVDQDLAAQSKVFVYNTGNKLKYLNAEQLDKYDTKEQVTIVREKINELEIPASWFSILNSFFIITFAPLFSRIWSRYPNISGPIKFAIGLTLLGIGFGALAYGSLSIPQGAATASVSIIWLILAYYFHTMGELCISPVGLSYVSKLAPVKLLGLMFGVWHIGNFIANTLAGLSGSFIDQISQAYSLSTFFLIFTAIPLAAALLMVILNPILKRMMHGIT